MRYAWPIYVIGAALVVAAGVLALLNLGSGRSIPSELTLRDSSGLRFEVGALRGSVWVASFLDRRCVDGCPEVLARLGELHDGLPLGVRLVTFVVDGPGLWPPRPVEAEGRASWVFLQGNTVDADAPEAVRRLAVEHLGFEAERLAELRDATQGVLLTVVDPGGRSRRRYGFDRSGQGGDGALAGVFGDVDFLVTLDRHPLLHAGLNAASFVLLTAGLLCIRRKIVRAHLVCMALALAVTLIFLVSYLYYHYHVGSVPFRGQGWSRPVYFGILLSHTVLAALVVPLALAALFHAARRSFERHKSIARWTLPVWLYVSATGVLIYCMLYLWFPGP